MPASPSEALTAGLAARGFVANASDVHWLSVSKSGLASRLAWSECLVRARRGTDPTDWYMVTVRTSPEGAPLEIGTLRNITSSTATDEGPGVLSADRRRFAYAAYSDRFATAVHVLDLAGFDMPDDFNTLQRLQTRLGQWQETGHGAGIANDVYVLTLPQAALELSWKDNATLIARPAAAGSTESVQYATIRAAAREVDAPEALAMRTHPYEKARPAALVQWAVDRVRATWFGEERMQWVKAIAFTAKEWKDDFFARFKRDNSAAEIARDMEGLNTSKTQLVVFKDPEVGWPPEPIVPRIKPALPGEGLWIALENDPFVTHVEGAPPAFVTSFIRSDVRRPMTRIYVTMWDPRQIALHMEAGTVEPQSSTGEAGTGMIPRTPELMKRLVAGFNGGFQAMHGEFGMEANGILYLPPKPWAATVAEMTDGATGFGSWPVAGGTSAPVPENMLSFRQNLTAIVEDGRINPWGRTWWGGTPVGWHDNIHTTRSGLCLTKEGYVGYFFGLDIAPEALGEGMLAARCTYGVHLDMNPGLAGFEFYDVDTTKNWKPLDRPLQADWETEGIVKELPEFHYRARRMLKTMQHMNFPQYIQRHGRDFFYLTVRDILPGPPLPTAVGPRPPWKTKGLPQHGFPYAVATAGITLAGAEVLGLRLDPKTVKLEATAGQTVLVWSQSKTAPVGEKPLGDVALALSATHTFSIQSKPGSDPLLRGVRQANPLSAKATVALGINDEDGMLTWLELAPGATPTAALTKAMSDLLEKSGCRERMFLPYAVRTTLGGTMTLDEKPADIAPPLARLVRVPTIGAVRLFEETKPLPSGAWLTLQSQRVRYFHRPQSERNSLNNAANRGTPAPTMAPAPTSAPTSTQNEPRTLAPAP